MRKYVHTGNGEWCPEDDDHGRMWVLPSSRQFCPSSFHHGPYMYESDGRTPATPTSAQDPSGSAPERLPAPLDSTRRDAAPA